MNIKNISTFAMSVAAVVGATACSTSASSSTSETKSNVLRIDNPDLTKDNGFVTFRDVEDGNYRVHVCLGGDSASSTVVRGESRRLFFENVEVAAGATKDIYFTINKRDTIIDANTYVRIKPRERMKRNWDSHLTFEFNGAAPAVKFIEIEKVDDVPTIFLCGNSTVVDQDNEPWASWGQMLPRFLNDKVCVANYAESGESSNTFIGARRLAKIATQMKAGDYIFVEFGHNDEKQKGEDKGPYKHFQKALREYIALAREKGATPVLVTPTQRRKFGEDGKLIDTHGEFPAACKALAAEENVALIDLHVMTTVLYEALGDEPSKRAFVHYPAGTYPGQDKDFADNTHFNPYGAYQIAKCIVEGIRAAKLPLEKYIVSDYTSYNPAQPDDVDAFVWYQSATVEIEKPDGN